MPVESTAKKLDRIERKLDMLIGLHGSSVCRYQPPVGGGGGNYDPYFDNVVSLLHFDGNLTDVKGNTWTANGSADTTGTAKFGTNSLLLAGSTAGVRMTASDNLKLTGDFTIECWVYPTNIAGGRQTIFSTTWNTGTGQHWLMMSREGQTAGKLEYFVGSYSTGTALLTSSGTLPQDTWSHVAITRSGNDWKLFVDAVEVASATGVNPNMDGVLDKVGVYFDGTATYNYGFIGRIDEYRVTKGVARTIAVPTAAFPNARDSQTDQYFGNVTSLLHFDHNTQDVISSNKWTMQGGGTVSGSPKFGTGAYEGNGSNSWLKADADYPGLILGTSDFTIECFVKFKSFRGSGQPDAVMQCPWAYAGYGSWTIWHHPANPNKICFWNDLFTASEGFLVSTTDITLNQWYHVAVTRVYNAGSGDVFRLYIDGVKEHERNTGGTYNFSKYLRSIGSYIDGGLNTYGYNGNLLVDEVRITKGVARYTGASFTVPTAAFPNS